MKQIWKWLCGRATQTLKIYILIPLILIVVSITALESYYITEKVTEDCAPARVGDAREKQ